jgi:hypothetical protein
MEPLLEFVAWFDAKKPGAKKTRPGERAFAWKIGWKLARQ